MTDFSDSERSELDEQILSSESSDLLQVAVFVEVAAFGVSVTADFINLVSTANLLSILLTGLKMF